ncbi:VOC family protein [Veillonella rodentium]|uniref:Virulence protein STM3117 n=1 Tax=Veillonella rodentium TaxID=248315 RepID=A0A239YP84_9FIRM|nr:VOC family protein [Veillonella rodentium]SNV60587.1 Virulence protein STM3117 [Veillonella rodentium]
MEVIGLDHIVITTADINRCIHFYGDIIGMDVVHRDGRYAIYFGNQKLNIHTKPAEFLPAAANPTNGSLDICFIVDEDISSVKKEIERKGYPIELGPVVRHGARGEMQSIYLRDPDGNLVELCQYGK